MNAIIGAQVELRFVARARSCGQQRNVPRCVIGTTEMLHRLKHLPERFSKMRLTEEKQTVGPEKPSLDEIMDKARPMVTAANIVRMLVFAEDLATVGAPQVPFSAVKVPSGLTVDLWGYAPQP